MLFNSCITSLKFYGVSVKGDDENDDQFCGIKDRLVRVIGSLKIVKQWLSNFPKDMA